MNYLNAKPKKTSAQLIKQMEQEQGITFKYISRLEAYKYIHNNNNYMRLASYRKNYQREGISKKYIDLDFAYLKELAIIDMYLREALLKMCIDIEHQLKINLLKDVEREQPQDGYGIVANFLLCDHFVARNIYNKRRSIYSGDLISKYFKFDDKGCISECQCPIWVFIEIISFGDFLLLYKYYYSLSNNKPPINMKILENIKSMRNASAHNNCLIYNIDPKNEIEPEKRHGEIYNFVATVKSISSDARGKKLKNKFIYETTCVVYAYNKIINKQRKQYVVNDLKKLFNKRMLYHKDYFEKNDLIKSSYNFISLLINFL